MKDDFGFGFLPAAGAKQVYKSLFVIIMMFSAIIKKELKQQNFTCTWLYSGRKVIEKINSCLGGATYRVFQGSWHI